MSNIIDVVNGNHDLQAMLNRAIATLVDLYTAKPHFIYELLQNAEDAEATHVVFVEKDDALQVLHNGRPFTERNLTGLTDIGLSDKLPETNKIGKFGVGFKSVFTICKDLYVASEPSHWKGDIKGLYPKFSARVTDYINLAEADPVAIPETFTTFFQFGYHVNEKRYDGFESVKEIQETIAEKLMDIGNTTLLFLKNIQTIEYRIEIGDVRKSGSYTLEKKKLSNILTDVITRGETDGEWQLSRYLKFTRSIKIDNVERSVDIAFKVETDAKTNELKFVKPDNGCVSVYFPTGTVSGLNLIVQGPFRTTPNRSEVLRNSPDNVKLVSQVAFLLRQAIVDLRSKGLVSAELLNMLPFDEGVFKHLPLFASLVGGVKQIFSTEAIFPGQEGGYWSKDQILLARNNEMAELFNGELMTRLIADGGKHVWVSTKIKQFREFDALFRCLSNEIGVPVMEPINLRPYFTEQNRFLSGMDRDWLVRMYKLYSDLPACFEDKKAKVNMLTACFIRTVDGRFVAPKRLDGSRYVLNIFRPDGSSEGARSGNVVDLEIYSRCRELFDDMLHLPVPSDRDMFLTDIVARYKNAVEIPDDEHINDIQTVLRYLGTGAQSEDIRKIVDTVLKMRGARGNAKVFRNAVMSGYVLKTSKEGYDLSAYFSGLTSETTFVDQEFYCAHGISPADLVRLGVAGSVVLDEDKTIGEDYIAGKDSVKWQTLGKFRRDLMLMRLPEFLNRIQLKPDEGDSREKSRIIYLSLVEYAEALQGKTKALDGTVSEVTNAKALSFMLNEKRVSMAFPREWNGAWLYSKEGILCSPSDIKISDLDEELYGKPVIGTKLVDILGFRKTKAEAVEDEVRNISKTAREVIFEAELRERQKNPEALKQIFEFLNLNLNLAHSLGDGGQPEDESFPIQSAGNLDRLKHHILELLAFADPVRFEAILRRVRITAIGPRARTYLKDLYGFSSGRVACQLCQKPVPAFEAVEIFSNPNLELEPMHLCLCRNCSVKYRELRQDGKTEDALRNSIEMTPLAQACSSSPIEFKMSRRRLWFTPLHFAEIKLLIDCQK